MPPRYTGFELSKKINEFLQDWELEKKMCFLGLLIMLLLIMFSKIL